MNERLVEPVGSADDIAGLRARPLADVPEIAAVEQLKDVAGEPDAHCLVFPDQVAAEGSYLPMAFVAAAHLPEGSQRVLPGANLYHLGVLESSIYAAWVRLVGRRLGRGCLCHDLWAYNNFPWPPGGMCLCGCNPMANNIVATAQNIVNVRSRHGGVPLGELYDPQKMPYDLLEAHRQNDKAVVMAYGLMPATTEADCMARLEAMHRSLTQRYVSLRGLAMGAGGTTTANP